MVPTECAIEKNDGGYLVFQTEELQKSEFNPVYMAKDPKNHNELFLLFLKSFSMYFLLRGNLSEKKLQAFQHLSMLNTPSCRVVLFVGKDDEIFEITHPHNKKTRPIYFKLYSDLKILERVPFKLI